MEIGTVWKKSVHICHPLVDLNFGADRAETAFTCAWYVADFRRMGRAGESRVTQTIRFSTVHDFPDIICRIPRDQLVINVKKGTPVLL